MKTALVSSRRSRVVALTSAATMALGLAACSSGSSGGGDSTAASGDKIGVSLITKDSTNPFFVAMQNGAKQAATKAGGIDLTIASGKADGDEAGPDPGHRERRSPRATRAS